MAKVDRKENAIVCFLVIDQIDPLYEIWIKKKKSKASDYVTDILGTCCYSPITNISLYWKVSGEQEYRDDGIIVYYRWKVPLHLI